MADIERSANALWNGTLREGNGTISTNSGALSDTAYTYATRFEQAPGTNPEELVAAAHAACFSMFLAATLGKGGYNPQAISTQATVSLGAGPTVTRIRLRTRATVEGVDDAAFQEAVRVSKEGCPISKALSAVPIEVEATLD